MPRQLISYEILIASPSDVTSERDLVSECIRDWNSSHSQSGFHCSDLRWELDVVPAMGARPQAIVDEQIVNRTDILIGIFKARIGTPTGISQSGTIEEIDRCIDAGKPVMLYFSNAPVPYNHDPKQLQLLKSYKKQMMARGVYAEFADENELRRKVATHLASTMTRISAERSRSGLLASKNDLARVFIRTRPGDRSGDVKTVRVSAIIENLSANRKITDYVCTISVPRPCLTYMSGYIVGELPQEVPSDRRIFRRSSHDPGAISIIFQGDKVPLFALDLGVDQLRMTGTHLAGDFEGTLENKVTVDAVIEGELLHAERTVSDIFANPTQS